MQASIQCCLRDAGYTESLRGIQPLTGGSMHPVYRLDLASGPLCIKLSRSQPPGLFEAERDGLNALHDSGLIRVPRPLAHGVSGGYGWLLLEYLPLTALDAAGAARLGTALARLHRETTANAYGWRGNNILGRTVQINDWMDNWPMFFWRCRLQPQLDLARQNGLPDALWQQAQALEDRLLSCLEPDVPASLCHGDLWSGNAAMHQHSGEPVLFDPAVSYGDGETDLAMMRLFGGFPEACFQAYRQLCPVRADQDKRQTFYQLYHVLNHITLFGRSYVAQAEDLIRCCLSC